MFKSRRPEILILLVAAFVALVLNHAFWRRFLAVVAPHNAEQWLFFAAALVTMVIIAYLLLLVVSLQPVLKVIVAIVLPVTAAASYFMNEYGVVIDANMVRNVFETDTREAGDLITVSMIAYIGLLGVLPAVLFCLVPWTKRTFGDEALAKLKFALPALVLLAFSVVPFWGDYLSLLRDHRELKLSLTPVNYISALSKYWRLEGAKGPKIVRAYGADAKRAVVISGTYPQIAVRRRRRRNGALGSFRAQWLWATDQSGIVESQRPRQLSESVLLRHRYGAISAVHVFRARQGQFQQRQSGRPGKPARYFEARRYRRAVA